VPLHNPFPTSERILLYGDPGAGKSTAYLNIAKWSQATGSDAQFYIGDTDNAVGRMLASYPDLTNIHVHQLVLWQDYVAFRNQVMPVLRPQDWLIVDFVGDAWPAVQDWFVTEVHGETPEDYFLAVRKAMQGKALGAFEGFTDWSVINKQYRGWFHRLINQATYNVLCTSKAEPLSNSNKPTEDPTFRSVFAKVGKKTVGQKDLPYSFHTLLLAGEDARGFRTLSTVKDRERKPLEGVRINEFALDYLKAVAGWELA
jgi:hypothetical protein